MTNHRQRAALDLLNIWTGEGAEDGYEPLAWTVDTDGHVQGELPPADRSDADQAALLGAWARNLNVRLQQDPVGSLHGTTTYDMGEAAVNVSLISHAFRPAGVPPQGSATVRAAAAAALVEQCG
ncbi:hypothetical protein ACGFZQ_37015 [Streptomyces sp. NPDC048254]|uniref:hypothetical protein n=1 Tax=Streptomyces sp. NPDC048254 TaxID=3365525 RepID=UPI003719E4E0